MGGQLWEANFSALEICVWTQECGSDDFSKSISLILLTFKYIENLPANAGDTGDKDLVPVSGRSPGVGNGSPTPVFLPGKSHGQKNLPGYRPPGHEESDMTEHTHMHACILQKQYGKKLCLRTRTCQISLVLTWIKTHFTLKGERLKGMQMAWTKNSHLVQFAQGDRLGNPQGNKSWAIEANGHCCKAQ